MNTKHNNSCLSRGCPADCIQDVSKPVNISNFASCTKLNITDWLEDIPETQGFNDIVEVRFKNTRKAFFYNVNQLRLKNGDIVAVEANPGHDIGVISLTGPLVLKQLQKAGISPNEEFKKIYRKAKSLDIEKWKMAIDMENRTMLRAREIALEMKLDMKIGDVEYQGDHTKAIFYYIADERVDFRQLIKVLAETFRIRVEMRQIGARQEAGRIGGIGPCGRELCCSTWISNFVSVTTNSARNQDLSMNPQKLAGQCGKLKCCLNYEVDCYLDATKDFPSQELVLETKEGKAFFYKMDVYKRIIWYSLKNDEPEQITPLPVERVKEIVALNNRGIKPENLISEKHEAILKGEISYENVVGQDSLTRFDDKKNKKKLKQHNKNRKNNKRPNRNNGQQKKNNQSQ